MILPSSSALVCGNRISCPFFRGELKVLNEVLKICQI